MDRATIANTANTADGSRFTTPEGRRNSPSGAKSPRAPGAPRRLSKKTACPLKPARLDLGASKGARHEAVCIIGGGGGGGRSGTSVKSTNKKVKPTNKKAKPQKKLVHIPFEEEDGVAHIEIFNRAGTSTGWTARQVRAMLKARVIPSSCFSTRKAALAYATACPEVEVLFPQ